MQRETQKINAKIAKIAYGQTKAWETQVSSAVSKYRKRKNELKNFGTYKTTMTDKEKVLYWCDCMGFDEEDLNKLLEVYDWSDLANMSGDEFYDEVKFSTLDIKNFEFNNNPESKGLVDLGIEDLGD